MILSTEFLDIVRRQEVMKKYSVLDLVPSSAFVCLASSMNVPTWQYAFERPFTFTLDLIFGEYSDVTQ